MKRIYLILATALCVAFTSCTNDEIVGGEDHGTPQAMSDAITFGSGFKSLTRATDAVGADAAAKLNNRFIVSGFKTKESSSPTNYSTVFKDYAVVWQPNTAGQTESNTSDWEYVGVTSLSPVTTVTAQTAKYWDYSAASYDFIAYSTGTASETADAPSAGQVQVTAIDHANLATKAYTLKGSKDDLAKCYIADMVTITKGNYKKEVELKFHSLTSKVRIGLYETIPGYSVKNVKFYSAHPTTLGTGSNTTATLIGTFKSSGTYDIAFTGTKATVNLSASTDATNAGFGTFPSTTIGTNSAAATFASGGYQHVIPTNSGNALELAVDYTLVSDDGSGEEINVYGATAYIPVTFTNWQPNFAYTYIFKISDNTNGWTSTVTDDPSGLFPITFDAVVSESEEAGKQATITTVATPSITTYQKGHDTTKNEYAASTTNPIFVQVMINNVLKGDLGTKGQLYTLSAAKTEADVLDALNIQESTTTTTITGRNGLVLTEATSNATITTIPGENGENISITAGQAASFAATANTYAYVYDSETWDGVPVALTTAPTGWPTGYYTNAACTTAASGAFAAGTYYQKESYIYTAEKYTTQPADFTTAGIYYEDPNGTKDVTSSPAATFSSETYYYKKYTVNHKVYGVKVIKVVS